MAKNIKEVNPNNFGGLLFDKKEKKAVCKVLKNKMIFRYGSFDKSEVDVFEEKIQELFNVNYCIAVSNGTSGLISALGALNIKAGDRVLVSSYTFLATALAVKKFGAIPVPMELDIENGIDLDDLKEQIEIGCKAVIVVQLQGRTYNLDKVCAILKEKNIPLIEDACQSFYCNNGKQLSGTIGDIGVFSFQQFKQLSAGEGGCVITNNTQYAQTIRNFTDMGSVRNGFPSWNDKTCVMGENYRMTNISATILLCQLKKLDYILNKQKTARNTIIKQLIENNVKVINSPYPDGDSGMNILVELNKKEDFNIAQQSAKKYGVLIRKMWNGVYYDNLLFQSHNLTSKKIKDKECEKTIEITDKILTIPIPPILNKKDCRIISKAIIEIKNTGVIK